MPGIASRPIVLDREFLEVRARLLDLAAALDRLDRAEGTIAPEDDRLARILAGIEALDTDEPSRAERIQRIFSLPYNPEWKATFGLRDRPGT